MRQRLFDRQEIAPGKTFLQRAAQQESRMESWHGANLALAGVKSEPAAPRFGDAFFNAEQGLRRRAAEANEDIWVGKFDLAQDKGQADLRFLRRRRAIAGRPPGYDVGDVNRG